MSNIQNKVVIITGASSGIGEATAYKLAVKLVCHISLAERLNSATSR